jgi:hypothetical protein
MKQILLCVTIATAIASSALVANSTTVPIDRIQPGSGIAIDNIGLNPQPLPPLDRIFLYAEEHV